MTKRNICSDRLKERAFKTPKELSYFTKKNNQWVGLSWRDYHHSVRAFAKALIWAEQKPEAKISILGFNRLEWLISAMGAQYIGCVSVGIYTASSAEEVSYVIDHSDAEILVVENIERYERQVKPQLSALPKLKHIILMSDEESEYKNLIKFKDFIKNGQNISDQAVDERFQRVSEDQVATMIYTSGTTGNPKAVMLSHKAIAWTVRTVVKEWQCTDKDKGISYLPLAHVAEQMLTVYAPVDCGMQSYFVESPEKFKENLKEIEPTVFFGVPRVYEKIYEGIKAALASQSRFKQELLGYLSRVSQKYYEAHHAGKMLPLLTSVQFMLAKDKVFSKIKKTIGLKNTRLLMVGAAPISNEILNFFCGIDMPIYEVYGQSENSGPTTLSLPGNTKIGSVGKALPQAEVKIADDGEILIKGPHLFIGYYKNPQATNETMKDGWLYSGDIGTIDSQGFLKITDRKKDILITAGGKNISPQNLESMLKHLPYIQSAVVIGDNKKYLTALLSPDFGKIDDRAKKVGTARDKIMSHASLESIHQELSGELAKINQKLAPVEQIKKYTLLPSEFSVETGEFTPTLKVKRKFVNQKYQKEIAQMYQ